MSRDRPCRECGSPITSRDRRKLFCTGQCRTLFNRRRAKRGAELYDLFMATRFDRKRASAAGVWSRMCRLAEVWRDQDNAQRAGRKSWQGLTIALAASALSATKTLYKVTR